MVLPPDKELTPEEIKEAEKQAEIDEWFREIHEGRSGVADEFNAAKVRQTLLKEDQLVTEQVEEILEGVDKPVASKPIVDKDGVIVPDKTRAD